LGFYANRRIKIVTGSVIQNNKAKRRIADQTFFADRKKRGITKLFIFATVFDQVSQL